VPADPSSPIPSALAQLAHAEPLQDAEPPQLLAYLAAIPDPRRPCGRRHPLITILGLAAAAVLTGARSMTAIAEWAADAPQPVRAALGARRDGHDHWAVPAETTIRRTLGRLDAEAVAGAIGAWLADRDRPGRRVRRRALAVDGKTLRGAKRHGHQVHLLSAMDHTSRAVLAQRQVDGAPGEVPAFRPLLADLELAGVVVTADALYGSRDNASAVTIAPARSRPSSSGPKAEISLLAASTPRWASTTPWVWSNAASSRTVAPSSPVAPRSVLPSTAIARRHRRVGGRSRSASHAPTARSSASASIRASTRRMVASPGG
jgi:hypothetical protein